MLTIYRVTPKNSTPLIDEKIKHVVIKNDKVKILDNKNYIPDSSSDFTFEVGKSHAKEFQKYIENNLEDFKKDSPAKFIELLKDKFDIQEQSEFNQEKMQNQENNLEKKVALNQKEQIKQYVLESLSSNTTPLLDRRNSVRYENIPESTPIRKTPSLYSLPNENLFKISPSEPNQDSEEKASLIASEQKIRLLITEKNNSGLFGKIKNHGEKIANGFFNGKEKSKILLSITTLAGNINKSSTSNELKQNILALNYYINNEDNVKELSRYRGISQSIATFFSYGNVTSKEYVKELQKEFNPLIKEIFPDYEVLSARPTI